MQPKIHVSYKLDNRQFPIDTKLDEKIREAMRSIGLECYDSGSGYGKRDLIFESNADGIENLKEGGE